MWTGGFPYTDQSIPCNHSKFRSRTQLSAIRQSGKHVSFFFSPQKWGNRIPKRSTPHTKNGVVTFFFLIFSVIRYCILLRNIARIFRFHLTEYKSIRFLNLARTENAYYTVDQFIQEYFESTRNPFCLRCEELITTLTQMRRRKGL